MDDKEIQKIKLLNQTWLTKIGRPIRMFFYAQVFLTLLSFIYCPFKSLDTVKHYKYERQAIKGTAIHKGLLSTDKGQEIVLGSIRLREAHIQIADTILILKNFLFKTEGIKHLKENKIYFTEKKWAWYAVWFFTLIVVLVSSKFSSLNDLKIKNNINIGLIFLILLYFFV